MNCQILLSRFFHILNFINMFPICFVTHRSSQKTFHFLTSILCNVHHSQNMRAVTIVFSKTLSIRSSSYSPSSSVTAHEFRNKPLGFPSPTIPSVGRERKGKEKKIRGTILVETMLQSLELHLLLILQKGPFVFLN